MPLAPFFLMSISIHAMSLHAGSTDHRDEAEFERFVAAETNRLYRLSLAIVDDLSDAEDAVQETMLIAWRRWSSVQAFANPSAWLTRVCVRQCIGRRRSRFRRELLDHSHDWSEGGETSLNLQGSLIDLHRAYQRLSPRQRAIVTLHFQYGFTVDECAALLGCRPGTARSHLGRAVAKLRKELTDG